jgi:hypothetical protein
VETLWCILTIAAALGAAAWMWRQTRTSASETRLAQARRDFHVQRERLEIIFIQIASRRSLVSGPAWDGCEFADEVAYVRNRSTKELNAFVGVKVAIEDSDAPPEMAKMLGKMHVSTAVFRFDRRHARWETDGRAILYLKPSEAIRFYQDDLEIIDKEMAEPA